MASTVHQRSESMNDEPVAPTSLPSAFDAAPPNHAALGAPRPPRPAAVVVARTASAPMPHQHSAMATGLLRRDSTTSLETAAALDFASAINPVRDTLQHSKSSSGTATTTNALPSEVLDAVVKVYCTHSPPNFALPWQRKTQHTSGSTGFVISGPAGERWLLTNAHSVSYHSQVKVRKRGGDTRFIARVLSIGRECDIALLTVDDDAFWDGIVPITFGLMPQLQESVSVVGFPLGGTGLSISAGVTSRIELQHYAHGMCKLLALQIDAAINSGNSGGPVFNAAGECVGIAFQTFSKSSSEGVGYVIPNNVLSHFIKDITTNGRYTGFPSLNVTWQDMESSALRAAYGMQAGQSGVLVREIPGASHEADVLRVDDIITSIDGVQVANDGSVPFRSSERVNFKFLVTQKFVGDSLSLGVLRDGQPLDLHITLRHYQYLVPPHLGNDTPSYLVVAGLVFTTLTDPYLESCYGSLGAAPVRLAMQTYYGVKETADQAVVLLSTVLSSPATNGYEFKDAIVTHFNGQRITNLLHLAKLVDGCTEEYMRFTTDSCNKVIVLEREVAVAATERVLLDNAIPARMSRDLQATLGD